MQSACRVLSNWDNIWKLFSALANELLSSDSVKINYTSILAFLIEKRGEVRRGRGGAHWPGDSAHGWFGRRQGTFLAESHWGILCDCVISTIPRKSNDESAPFSLWPLPNHATLLPKLTAISWLNVAWPRGCSRVLTIGQLFLSCGFTHTPRSGRFGEEKKCKNKYGYFISLNESAPR